MSTQDLGAHRKYVDSQDFGGYAGFRWACMTCMGTLQLQASLGTSWVVLKAFLGKAQADRRCVRGRGRGRGVIITLQGVKLQLD